MSRVDSEWEKLLEKSQPSVFPDEIMFEILSRLPIKPIIRFKSVCKKWLELFGDSSFIAAHLKRPIKRSGFCNLVNEYFHTADNAVEFGHYYFSDENLESLLLAPFVREPSVSYEIVGSVDGLVCIHKFHGFKNYVLLWNPATRESRTLPRCAFRFSADITGFRFDPKKNDDYKVVLGFGFDPRKNDYKVVAMTSFEKSKWVDVYSLRNDTWRSFKVDDNFIAHQIYGVHVNGRLHWLATRKSSSSAFIASFDLTDEKIIEIDVPVNRRVDHLSLKRSGKSLVLALWNDDHQETEIWLMKEPKSWSKLYNISPPPSYGNLLRQHCFFFVNGKVIMGSRYNFNKISFDPNNEKVYKILPIGGAADIVDYKQSLVSVLGDGNQRSRIPNS